MEKCRGSKDDSQGSFLKEDDRLIKWLDTITK